MLFVGMFDASVQKVLRQFVARGSPHPISTRICNMRVNGRPDEGELQEMSTRASSCVFGPSGSHSSCSNRKPRFDRPSCFSVHMLDWERRIPICEPMKYCVMLH